VHCCVEMPPMSLPMPNLILPSGLSVPLPSVSLPYMPPVPGTVGGVPPGVSLTIAPTMPSVNLAAVSLAGGMPATTSQLDAAAAAAAMQRMLFDSFVEVSGVLVMQVYLLGTLFQKFLNAAHSVFCLPLDAVWNTFTSRSTSPLNAFNVIYS